MFILALVSGVVVEELITQKSARAQEPTYEGANSQTMELLTFTDTVTGEVYGTDDFFVQDGALVPAMSMSESLNEDYGGHDHGAYEERELQEEDIVISRYTVKDGDTLSSIANLFGVSVVTLRITNKLDNAATIRPGQIIEIPPYDGVPYIVRSGDTVSGIASTFEVSGSSILDANLILDPRDIRPGQRLFIPGATVSQEALEKTEEPASSSMPATAPVVTQETQPTTPVAASPTSSVSLSARPFIEPSSGIMTRGQTSSHRGIDVGASTGTPIVAAADGVVTTADSEGYNGGFGGLTVIWHPAIENGSIKTLYAHQSRIVVSVGDVVKQGDIIGYVGSTGRSTGPHLHFEVRKNDAPIRVPGYLYGWAL